MQKGSDKRYKNLRKFNTMREAGIPAVKVQTENDDFIEYVIQVPKMPTGHDGGLSA